MFYHGRDPPVLYSLNENFVDLISENKRRDEEDDDDDDDEDERELSIEDPRYVAEKALLQELFFPEAEKAPSDDAGKMILSLPPPSLSFLLNFTNPNISAFLDIKCFSFVFAAL